MTETLEDEFGIYGADEIHDAQACEDYSRQLERHRGPEKARHPDEPPLRTKSAEPWNQPK